MNKVDKFNYYGSIKISEFDGNRKLNIKRFHNQGFLPLFRFFAKCLGGDYSSAEFIRPTKIKLFTTAADVSVEDFDWADKIPATNSFIYLDSTVIVNEDKATFKFSIPFSYLRTSTVRAVALYGKETQNEDEPSAYYLLTKKEDKTSKWDEIKVDDKTTNYNLLIEWTLQVGNKSTEEE